MATKKPASGKRAPKPAKAKSRVPNAESLQALADIKADNLTRYVDEDDLLKTLGINEVNLHRRK